MTTHIARRDFLKHATLLATASTCAAQNKSVTAETSFGKVRGVEADGIKIFKGIPYGASTAGKNRFMPPVNPEEWTGVRDALEYGPTAPQTEPGARRNAATNLPAEGEDCLVLNVWTPAINDGRRRPVMFWCHGGGFATGSGSSRVTEGANLARRGDVVVVTINHRLNVLGFTNLEEFGGQEFATSGDVGVLDIVHALKWVKQNIQQFGGDPNTVMIFGQSGGGRKVGTLLAMPSAKDLFHRAIIQSGPSMKLVDRDQSTRVAGYLLAKLGVSKSKVRDLQTLPVDQIMSAYFAVMKDMGGADPMTQGFSPTMDGKAIAQHPFHPTAAAVSPNVPVMTGSTRTELTSSADEAAFSLTEADMRARVNKLLGEHASPVIDVYSKANPRETPSGLYFLIASDHRYGAPAMNIAERRSALSRAPVYLYYFCWETPVRGGRLKSPHGIEVPFAFDNVKTAATTSESPDAQSLADKVSAAWIAFARTGNPNTGKLPQWPAFDLGNRPTMVINNESRVENDPIREQRIVMSRAMGLS